MGVILRPIPVRCSPNTSYAACLAFVRVLPALFHAVLLHEQEVLFLPEPFAERRTPCRTVLRSPGLFYVRFSVGHQDSRVDMPFSGRAARATVVEASHISDSELSRVLVGIRDVAAQLKR